MSAANFRPYNFRPCNCQSCIWQGDCSAGHEDDLACSDYSPADEQFENELYYLGVLAEDAEEYRQEIREYGDGNYE